MTKVLRRRALCGSRICFCLFLALSFCNAEDLPGKPAEALYLQLGSVGLDPQRVYRVRGAALNRSAVQITLEDGTIAFTQDINGRITGAFFEGYGEILLVPPNEVERRSLTLFTGMAILEERFETAYFRFNDDAANELRPDLRELDSKDKQEFIQRWGITTQNLATLDAMRLLTSFSRFLPLSAPPASIQGDEKREIQGPKNDHFLHARLQGTKFGVFDVYYDSTVPESVQAGQARKSQSGESYYDVWTSFMPDAAPPTPAEGASQEEKGAGLRINIRKYKIVADVIPPKQIHARATLECEIFPGESRVLLFELSRFLQIEAVKLNGQSIEFIHNPALEGTQLSRQGNDVVALMLPNEVTAGKKVELEFIYGGEVLAEAGPGLLYVGARGTWYPNRGMQMADFDLEFKYPQEWTLVATGKSTQVTSDETVTGGQQASRWVSEQPIPVAGFNLGKYRKAISHAGNVSIETYATQNVEKNFPSARIQVINPEKMDPALARHPEIIVPTRPSPARNVGSVGESAARAIEYFAERFGPFPYSHIAFTQLPGGESQGWPGLVFLTSYAFLNDEEREQLHFTPIRILTEQSITPHETAHQWWGDLVQWQSYRDQWLSEALANYSALMMLQDKDPAGFMQMMEHYRADLVEKNSDGISPMEAGPVTLGTRLLSSRFPGGYQAISYGRGTWLLHMLRNMLKDGTTKGATQNSKPPGVADEPFIRALRRVRERYAGKAITTQQLLDVFAEDLPPALRYEGKKSLDWFLEGWVNGTALPKFELKNVKFATKSTGLNATGTILQKDAPSDLVTSIPIYAVLAGKQQVFVGRIFADGEESTFRLSVPAGTRRLVPDPYNTVLTSPK